MFFFLRLFINADQLFHGDAEWISYRYILLVMLTGVAVCFQGIAQEILADLVEDACLGLCFEVHRAVKQGYFFLDDTDQESTKDFGKRPLNKWNVFLIMFKKVVLNCSVISHKKQDLYITCGHEPFKGIVWC